MNYFHLIGEIILGRCMTGTDLHSDRSVRKRFKHILISLVIADGHDKIILIIIQKLFSNGSFVYTGDTHLNHFVAIDDLQRCISYKVM